MKGGVRKRGDIWYYYFDLGHVNGKRKKIERKGGATKAEAERALRKAIDEYENYGDIQKNSDLTLSDYLDYWYDNYVLVNLKMNTQDNYRGIIDNHLKPAIGKYKLKSLSPTLLQEYLNSIAKSFSKKTVSIHHCVLAGALKKAVYPWKLIKENPMAYVSVPKYDEGPISLEKLKVISMDDFNRLCDMVKFEDTFYMPLMLGFHTGMRVSEVCGLTWDHVDLEKKIISVEKILLYNQTQRQWVFGTPKTRSSYRDISIGPSLLAILQRQKQWQDHNKALHGEHYIISDFVCTKPNGKVTTPASVKASTQKYENKLGIPFNFHSLRHTHATLLLENGANIKDIQTRLGHQKISTTLDTYSHVTKAMSDQTVSILENILLK